MLNITYYSPNKSGFFSPFYLLLFIFLFTVNFSFLHAAAPTNDACSNATALTCGTTSLAGTTVSSVSEVSPSSCSSEYGVWYKFTGDGQQTTISSTATFDHELTLVSGSCGSFVNIACVDGTTTSWTYTFTTTIGVQYYIYVAHWLPSSTTTGTFTISRTCTPAPTPPANDACSNATSLPCGTTSLAGTTVNSVSEATAPATDNASKFGVWYTFTGNNQSTTITSTAGLGYDHKMVIMSGSSCGSFAVIATLDGSGSGGTETHTFTPTTGVQYYVYIAHYSTSNTTTGTFTMNRSCVAPCSGAPTGGATVLSPTSGNPNSTVNGSVTGATTGSGLTYQWQYSDNGSAPWTDIVGQNTETLSTTAKSTLGTRYYRRAITCASTTSYSTSVIYTTQITYCTPSAVSSSYFIRRFSTTGGVANITNNGTGYTPGGYGNFTSQIASQVHLGTVNFSTQFDGSSTYGLKIWIDWNQDGDFIDAGEEVFASSAYANIHTGSFVVPATALVGNTRMRIGSSDYPSTGPSGPCETNVYGEYEDYTFKVIALPNCSGTPAAGTPTVSSISTCPGYTFTVAVTGYSYGYSGLTGIWQSSPHGSNTWTDVAGTQNLPSYVVTSGIATDMDYRYKMNCSYSGINSFSSIIEVFADCNSNSPGCPDVNINPGSLTINGNDLVIPCGSNTATLNAEYLKTGGTQTYRVESIPYAPPFPFTGGTGSTSITDDDEWSDIIDLGFDFCFYGNTFNKALFGSNGAITFDIDGVIPGGRYSPNNYSGYSFTNSIPSNSAGTTLPYVNAIMGVLQDTDPAANLNYSDWSINYQIMGFAPCRMLVVNMYNLALYDCETSEGPQTYQMVIYETTNAIDVYVKDRKSCETFNSGSGLIGLQNADGSQAIAPPGRNTGKWEAHNEAWRFIPDGMPNYDFAWYDASNNIISTNDELVAGPGTYKAKIVYHSCYGVDIVKEQTLTITKETVIAVNALVNLNECEATSGSGVAYFDLTQNNSNALGSNNASDFTVSYYNTQANALSGGATGKITTATNYQNTSNPQTVWARIQKNSNVNCNDVASFQLSVKTTPSPSFVSVSPATNVCYGTNVTYTTQSGMTNYSWSIPGTAGANYTLISGGTATSNSAVIAWNTSTNGTIVQVNYDGSNGCTGLNPANSISVALPTKGIILGNNADSATCVVNDNSYIHFYHSTGRLLASINSNGQNLGNVTVTSYVEPSHLSVPACLDPTNPSYTTATMKRHWVITPEFQPASAVTVRLPFDDGEFTTLQTLANGNANANDNLATIANVKLSKYKGPLNVNNLYADNCSNAGGSGGTQLFGQAANGSVTAYQTGFSASARYTDFSIPNFSEFWLHGSTSSPLPVNLANFSLSCENNATISWTTASEQNSDRFIIEKSRDGQNWIAVGEKTAAGNSNTLINYSIVDENNWNGVSYYRMIQIDINGKQEVYGPISADCGSENNSMIVYPNPSNGTFTVEISASENISDGQIQLFDVTGKLILNQITPIQEGINQVYFNNVDLQMGSYLVKFLGGNNTLKPIKIVIK